MAIRLPCAGNGMSLRLAVSDGGCEACHSAAPAINGRATTGRITITLPPPADKPPSPSLGGQGLHRIESRCSPCGPRPREGANDERGREDAENQRRSKHRLE